MANVRQTVIENSDHSILLVDHTKFGKSGFISVCGLEQLDYLITDQPLNDEWTRLLVEKQVKVLDGTTGG